MEKYIVEVYEDVVYWKNEEGQHHRLGGLPAIEWDDGSKEYWENGKCHRLGGLPAVECANGDKAYWENGQRHRLGGLPAVECANGYKSYYENGKPHREDGPTVNWKNRKEFWYRGEKIDCKTTEEFKRLLKLKAFW